MTHAYTEDALIEQPAIQLFSTLGWQSVSAMEEIFGPGGTLGRETKSEVVLGPRLRAALERLNPGLPPEAITTALGDLTRDRSAMSLTAANRDVYGLLKEGISVSVPDRERGGQKTERVRVIDWENPEANDFLLVSQMTITGPLYTCRPDLIGFVNGLPWIVIESKKPGASPPGRRSTTTSPATKTRKTAFPLSSGTTRCSSLQTAQRAVSARSQRIGSGSSSGSGSSGRTSRGACRWR